MLGSLLTLFDWARGRDDTPPAPRVGGCVLNYLWLNPQRPIANNAPHGGVPPEALERMFENARRYPQARVILWLEGEYDFMRPDNVELRNITPQLLNKNMYERDGYMYSSPQVFPAFFSSNNPGNIWSRVDMARLLMLRHCFETMPVQDVFYADFDTADVKLDAPEVLKFLDKDGFVLAKTTGGMLENGYFGLRRGEGEVFLNKCLLPASTWDLGYTAKTPDAAGQFTKDGRPLNTGWPTMFMAVGKWAKQKGRNPNHYGVQLLEKQGYRLPAPNAIQP